MHFLELYQRIDALSEQMAQLQIEFQTLKTEAQSK